MLNKEITNHTPTERTKEIDEKLRRAYKELFYRTKKLSEICNKSIPAERKIPPDTSHHKKSRLERIYDEILKQNSALAKERYDVNRKNFSHLRDRWVIFSATAIDAANRLTLNGHINSAWHCINMATYHIGRAEMILEIEFQINQKLREKQKRKSRADSNQITKNEKNRLVELFLQNAPDVGWKNLKLALHEIRPQLIADFKIKKPQASQQELEQASDDLQRKLRNWMRTDPVFKSQINRHIQNKSVPDFSHLD